MRRLWLVRLGKHGEQEAHALETGELVLGFQFGDLTAAKGREAKLAARAIGSGRLCGRDAASMRQRLGSWERSDQDDGEPSACIECFKVTRDLT